jgi:ribosomal protein S18 acetylase RimI-like enzyme
MEVGLRPVCDADEPFLMSVYGSTREEELALVPWTAEQKQSFVEMQFEAQSAHYSEHYAGMTSNVVLIDGEPAGRLLVARWSGEIRIVDIALLPGFRGRGAGGRLLAELMDEAAGTGKRLSIHVERYNRALGLYRRLGFEPAGGTGVYLRLEWDPAGAAVR